MKSVKIAFSVLYLATIAVVITACSGEDPQVNYTGISAENAVQLLKGATNDIEREKVLSRVDDHPQYGFQWDYFWNQVAVVVPQMNFSQRTKLFDLSRKQCSQSSLNAFAQVLLKYPENFSYLFSADHECREKLTEDNFEKYFDVYAARLESATPKLFTEFSYLLEVRRPVRTQSVMAQMDKIPPSQWTRHLQTVLQQKQPDIALSILKVYNEVYGSSGLVDVVLLPMTETPEAFDLFFGSFGFEKTLDFLGLLPKSIFSSDLRSVPLWQHLLDKMVAGFQSTVYKPRTFATPAIQAFRDFEKIHSLMSQLDQKLEMLVLLEHFDRLARTAEQWILREDRPTFFNNVDISPLSVWSQRRLMGKISESDVEKAFEGVASRLTPLYEVHQLRLAAFASADPDQIHLRAHEYCALLEKRNIKTQAVKFQNFSWDLLQKPGCLHLVDAPMGATISASVENLAMSSSAVFMTGGVSLEIKATKADLSLIDLSTDHRHEDLPVEPAPDSAHAVAFPLLVGFQLLKATPVLSPGIHYVATHFTFRKASAGEKAKAVPADGFPGGNLQMTVSDRNSVVPQVVSLGGAGQKAVMPTQGGRSSRSVIVWDHLQKNLLASVKPSEDLSLDRRLLAKPNIRTIQHLWETAVKDSETQKIKAFIDTNVWWNSIGSEDQSKVLQVCGIKEITSLCAHDLAERASQQIAEEIKSLGGTPPPHAVLQRLSVLDYTESAGALGPVNADGERGPPGSVVMEGFE